MSARPLSPFLNYRLAHTMVLSFAHRASGAWLSLGLVALVWWLMALVGGERSYRPAAAFYASWYGRALLMSWLAAFCYHLVNGLRHLSWDAGWGLEKAQARRSAVLVVLVALCLLAVSLYWLCCPQAVRP